MTDVPPIPVASVNQESRANGSALAGMILGIVSLPMLFVFGLGVLSAIVGLILSIIGLGKSRRVGVGRGKALAGLILSCIAIALVVVGLPLLGVMIWFRDDLAG